VVERVVLELELDDLVVRDREPAELPEPDLPDVGDRVVFDLELVEPPRLEAVALRELDDLEPLDFEPVDRDEREDTALREPLELPERALPVEREAGEEPRRPGDSSLPGSFVVVASADELSISAATIFSRSSG
jgi:hypothetical protein